MNWPERSVTANVAIRMVSKDFVSQTGKWSEVTKDNIWNLINGGDYTVEYIPSADETSTDTFIITEVKH